MSRKEELAHAKEMLKGWQLAEVKVMTGQEYRMGTMQLKRADLSQIADRIKHWQNEVLRLEKGSDSSTRVQRVVVRDDL